MRIAILGPLEVTVDGQPVRMRGPRQEKLLGALAIDANRTVPMGRLADALWDDDPPATATRQVQNIVGMVRKLLADTEGEILIADGNGYRLRLADGQLDADVFAALAADARRAAEAGDLEHAVEQARAALALWRGPMLAGIDSRSLQAPVAGWEERRLALVEQCLGWELRLGRHAHVVAELRHLVAEHRTRERLVEQLMLALYRGGRQGDALSVYRDTRQALADELGLDPGRDLQQLHGQILANDPELDQPVPAKPAQAAPLPAASTPELGRPPRRVLAAAGVLALLAAIAVAVLAFRDSPQPQAAVASTPPAPPQQRILANDSRWVAVAASFERDGGECPPLAPSAQFQRCGTCDVPAGARSSDSCAWLFPNVDAFTFDKVDFRLDDAAYHRHTYVRVPAGAMVRCTDDAGQPTCRTELSPG